MIDCSFPDKDAGFACELETKADINIFTVTEESLVEAANEQEQIAIIHCSCAAGTETMSSFRQYGNWMAIPAAPWNADD